MGQDPYQLMQQWTERQLRTYLEWLNLQWNEPDRCDHYLMQITQAVKATASKKRIKLGKLKIPFEFKRIGGKTTAMTEEAANTQMDSSKAYWGTAMANPGPRPPKKPTP